MNTMNKLNILIVDDSPIYSKIIASAIESTNLAFTKSLLNGKDAIKEIQLNSYDLVILDINMPIIDGFETLLEIKKNKPSQKVIMISGISSKDSKITIKCLENGALDFIVKPLEGDFNSNKQAMKDYFEELFKGFKVEKIQKPLIEKSVVNSNKIPSNFDLVLIASSLGGPIALEKLFNKFGLNFFKPLLLVQHIPVGFSKALAESLDEKSHLKFLEASNGLIARSGQGIIAAGGYHMTIKKEPSNIKVFLDSSPPYNGIKPCADITFKSVAQEMSKKNILVIVLTGMGNDGTEGIRVLKEKCNCYCITQSQKTCSMYGMPKNVYNAGLSDEVLDLQEIPDRLLSLCSKS